MVQARLFDTIQSDGSSMHGAIGGGGGVGGAMHSSANVVPSTSIMDDTDEIMSPPQLAPGDVMSMCAITADVSDVVLVVTPVRGVSGGVRVGV